MIIYEIIKKAILKLSASNSKLRKSQKHRLQTVNLLIINIIKYIIVIIVILLTLATFGVNISS